jgi:hypothetical protein
MPRVGAEKRANPAPRFFLTHVGLGRLAPDTSDVAKYKRPPESVNPRKGYGLNNWTDHQELQVA